MKKGVVDPTEIDKRVELFLGSNNYNMKQIYNYKCRQKNEFNVSDTCLSGLKENLKIFFDSEKDIIYKFKDHPFILTMTTTENMKKIKYLENWHSDHTYKCSIPAYPILLL